MRRLSPSRWQRGRSLRQRADCTLEAGRMWCFGRTYTQPECSGVCKSGDILAADRGEEELPTNLSALVYSLFQKSALVQAKGLKLSIKEHHSRHGHWLVQVTSLSAISHVDLPCSVQFAFDFEQISRSCLHHRPWFLTPDWVMILGSTLVTTSSPPGPCWSGLGAVLWFQQQLSQPSKDQICAKERSSLWGEGRGMAGQRGCVGGQVYRKDQETGAGYKQRAPWEEEKISEIQRRKDGKKIVEN